MAEGPASSGPRSTASRGQVLVVFALAITALLAFAGLAFDVGRFYTERRFLQNAADAGALAAANAMIRGETAASAEAEARDVLTRNFAAGPNGVVPTLPPVVPEYEPGHAGDPLYLRNGILITNRDVRVAIRSTVDYTFGRVVGLGSTDIGSQARAGWRGRLLPIAVRRFINAPGPNTGVAAPCPLDLNLFLDAFATELTACLGDELNAVLRLLPQPGAPWDPLAPNNDPANHGPIVRILGQGADPQNGADFRGFVALDIRNFASSGSQLYYNGVSASTNPNTLKDTQAQYILDRGYPGPDFPPAVTPPDPNNQVAALSGNSTGAAVAAMAARYAPGDEILVGVYPGQLMSIPDFTVTAPAFIALPATGVTVNAGVLRISRNQSFTGTVALSTLADTRDPASPLVLGSMAIPLLGSDAITYLPNPVTPSLGSGTSVLMQQLTTVGAVPGIYNVWIKALAGSPYLTTKYVPVAVQIGTVTRDFALTSDQQAARATNVGDSVSYTLTLQNSPNQNTAFGGPVTLSVDEVSGTAGQYGTGLPPANVSWSSTSVTPTRAGATTTLTVNTAGLAPGTHRFVVRATGMNGDTIPRKVTHLLPLTLNIATGESAMDYVDIVGFAVMRIAEIGTNYVSAYAVTPVIADMNDPRLVRGQQARLVPWS
jgi:hypothetical protein